MSVSLLIFYVVGCPASNGHSITGDNGVFHGTIENEKMEIFLKAMLDMLENPKYEGYDIVNKNKDKKYTFKFNNIRTLSELLNFIELELNVKIKDLKKEKILLIQKEV